MNDPMDSRTGVSNDTPIFADSRGEIYNEHAARFTLKPFDLGRNLALHGLATEDIATVMKEYRSRVQINSHDTM